MLAESKEHSRSALFLTTDRQIDRRTLQQADTLEAAGWSVSILAMPLDKAVEKDDPRVVRITMTPQRSGFVNYVLWFSYRIIRRLIPMHAWLMRMMKKMAWVYLTDQTQFYLRLFSYDLSRYVADVIIAVDLPMLPVGQIFSQKWGARLVYDSHELYCEQEFSRQEKKQWQAIEAKTITFCDTVITVNPSIATELMQRYTIKNIKVLYNAVPHYFPAATKKLFHQHFNLPIDRKILLFQGGLSKGRHLEVLIEAMRYVKNGLIDLVILGEGQLYQSLKKHCAELNLKNRVYFHPAVSQDQLLDYTQSADAGIIPYQATCLNHYYCTPNKLFEFIAAGLPILATDLPEINNIVNTHQLGLTGDTSSPWMLAKLIDAIFSDEIQLQAWQKNVLAVQNQFSWQHEEKKLLEIFENFS